MTRHFDQAATLHTRSGAHPLQLKLADHFGARLHGLMGAAPLAAQQGLWLSPCSSVHGLFLRQGLDLLFLGAAQRQGATQVYPVQHTAHLRPWGAKAHFGSRHTLELPAGSLAAMQVQPGDTVVLHRPGGRT